MHRCAIETALDLTTEVTADGAIRCGLRSRLPNAVEDPVLCFSLLAPVKAISACKVVEQLGGFTAVELKTPLPSNGELTFSIAYDDESLRPFNRAWLPLGCYLCGRFDDQYLRWNIASTAIAGVAELAHRSQSSIDPVPLAINLVPVPSSWEPGDQVISIGNFALNSADYLTVAERVNQLAERCGFAPFTNAAGVATTISIDSELSAECYRLVINNNEICLFAADDSAVFYGLVSLLNLRELNDARMTTGVINDSPRFLWRGQHLDCARHFYHPDTICRLLDLMALVKLNRFHWHFSDDEAFRVELNAVAELSKKTAYRGHDEMLPGVFGGGLGPTGGVYSKADVARIVSHAKSLCIDVLPEIEFPAHALCLNRVHPYLRDANDAGSEQSVQGYLKNVVNPATEECLPLFKSISMEIKQLFPFSHLHLGGDELPDACWQGSPLMDDYKKANGLVTADDVLGFSMHELASFLIEHEMRPCAWEESARGCAGGIHANSVLFLWQGNSNFASLARRGYTCVLCPAQNTYMDMAHTDDADDWGARWAATISLEQTVEWEPLPEEHAEFSDRLLGIQGSFWSEFTTEDEQMEPMVSPRILGISCKAWSQRDAVSGATIVTLAQAYEPLFAKLNWQMAPKSVYR